MNNMLLIMDSRRFGMGAVVSLAGMYASYRFDLPTGAAVICLFGVVLGGMALFKALVPACGCRR